MGTLQFVHHEDEATEDLVRSAYEKATSRRKKGKVDWTRLLPKYDFPDGAPCDFTVDNAGVQYKYKKGQAGPDVELRQVYYAKDPVTGGYNIGSPHPLKPGAVRVNRKDGGHSVHLVGPEVILPQTKTNVWVDKYGQQTWLYGLGPESSDMPQDVTTSHPYRTPGEVSPQEAAAAVAEKLAYKLQGGTVVGTVSDHKKVGGGDFYLSSIDGKTNYKVRAASWGDAVQHLANEKKPLAGFRFGANYDLTGVVFGSALRGSTFENTTLKNAFYSYGDLREVTITKTNIDGLSVRGTVVDASTKISECDLSNLNWHNVSALRAATFSKVTGIPNGMPHNITLRQTTADGSIWTTQLNDATMEMEWAPEEESESRDKPAPEETGTVKPKVAVAQVATAIGSTQVAEVIVKESVNMSKPNFKQMVLSDAEKAAYRITARNVVKLGREAILKILEAKGGDQAAAFSQLLNTEVGNSLVSGVMGGVLTFMPQFQSDARVQTLAEELRVHGMATLGNALVDQLTEIVAPAMSAMMTGAENIAATVAIPAESSVYKKPTLVQPTVADEEHEEEAEGTALKSATLR